MYKTLALSLLVLAVALAGCSSDKSATNPMSPVTTLETFRTSELAMIIPPEVCREETAYGGDIIPADGGAWYGNIQYELCKSEVTAILWAGQTIPVGTVKVSSDGINLYVKYNTTDDWHLKEVHLYVLGDAPDTRLPPGGAPYKQENISTQEYLFTVPLADLNDAECGTIVWLQAHAVVDCDDNGPDPQEALTVTKTAVTSYTRTHSWDIDKSVATENEHTLDGFPKIWLYIDGSGNETATWTVDVTYKGYQDSDFNISGEIKIENTGEVDAVITAVADLLAGNSIAVVCGVEFPYDLPVGATLTCTYDEDGYVEGNNIVTVTTESDAEYTDEVPIVWGEPTTEVDKTVDIKDISDLFGAVALGTVTAPNDAQFTYDKDFAWADYGVGETRGYTYNNTATIVETGQSADATLKVNVQGYDYETAYAKDDAGICFIPTFANWGWTNPITPGTYEMDLWAAAGQCDTSKGTLVGSVTVVYNGGGVVTVTYNVEAPYILDETHVYAGYDKFPKDRRGRNTVAPGQYTNSSPFDGSQVYVIAHAVVGVPDPNFGP